MNTSSTHAHLDGSETTRHYVSSSHAAVVIESDRAGNAFALSVPLDRTAPMFLARLAAACMDLAGQIDAAQLTREGSQA